MHAAPNHRSHGPRRHVPLLMQPGQPGSPFASEQEIEEMISELVDNS